MRALVDCGEQLISGLRRYFPLQIAFIDHISQTKYSIAKRIRGSVDQDIYHVMYFDICEDRVEKSQESAADEVIRKHFLSTRTAPLKCSSTFPPHRIF